MTEDIAVKSYVDQLFKYLETYESNYAQFETEAFLQTYNGICAMFQALRRQRDKAVALDEHFLNKIKQMPLNSSDLRQLAIQVLVSFFESEADIDGQSDRAYSYCRGVRGVKQDVPFFENHLVPLLFREDSLNNNFRLNSFFLGEIARFINTFGKPLNTDLSPEAFAALSDPLKYLELARRRHKLGDELIKDRTSLEFHLQRVDSFGKLAQKSRLGSQHLHEWAYLKKADFWSKVKSFFAELWGKLKGAFSSWRYFRLVFTQRNPAYVFYTAIILIFILLAIYVPLLWSEYGKNRLDQFQKRTQENWQPGQGN
ncbi:MAG: hypothetical protein ACE5K8_04360 [Candidatus Zixiibacteriota bacterium]